MLREIRIRHGIRIQELAGKAGLSAMTINNAEHGKAISAISANRIISALSELSGQSYSIEDLGIQTSERKRKDIGD